MCVCVCVCVCVCACVCVRARNVLIASLNKAFPSFLKKIQKNLDKRSYNFFIALYVYILRDQGTVRYRPNCIVRCVSIPFGLKRSSRNSRIKDCLTFQSLRHYFNLFYENVFLIRVILHIDLLDHRHRMLITNHMNCNRSLG